MQNNFIQKLSNIVEANLENESFGPDELARDAGMSHSNLNRKLKSITNQNASQFIREFRLNKAKELLINDDLTVAEISYRIGFGSPTYFNTCFHASFGVSPGEYRNHVAVNEPGENQEEGHRSLLKRTQVLIFSIIGLLSLVSILYFIYNKSSSQKSQKEKSIAVLTFKYLGDDTDKQYLADGMTDAILVHLSRIKDLRVVSRTSVEQYRESVKTSKAIGRELNVEYVLEGSFLMEGDQGRLLLQLIRTSDDSHVWSETLDHNWRDVFSVQSEVAEAVAAKLHAVITPAEQQLIRKAPTSNLTAYDYYMQGKRELEKYEFSNKGGLTELKKGQYLFMKALEADSTFPLAYTGLAAFQFKANSWLAYNSAMPMDTVLLYANKALSYDPECAEAYYFRARAYSSFSGITEAFKNINKALELNPNYWRSLALRSSLCGFLHDHVGEISNMYEVVLRNRGVGLSHFLTHFSYKLAIMGFTDLGRKYLLQALDLDGDSLRYFRCLAWMEFCDKHFENAYQLSKTVYLRDSTLESDIGLYRAVTGRYEDGVLQEIKQTELALKSGSYNFSWKAIAYYYWRKGKIKDAEFYIDKQIKFSLESIARGRLNALQRGDHFDLAEMYALRGDKEKAYYYLDEVIKNPSFPLWWVILFEHEPNFDDIRQEPRFQKILKEVVAKYQAEHLRVGKWLKGKGLI